MRWVVAWRGRAMTGCSSPSARSTASNLVVFPTNRNVAASFDHGHAEEVTRRIAQAMRGAVSFSRKAGYTDA